MKPITYKDNVSELVSISVKEAMQMLIDNDCKPAEVLDECGKLIYLLGVEINDASFPFLAEGCEWYSSIYRRENYIIGYNGEKLPPLPEGYGLVPENKGEYFSGIHCHPKFCFQWSIDRKWILPEMDGMAFACKIDSSEWRALFPPKPSIQLELGKWYERADGFVFEVMRKSKNLCFCSDEEYRYNDGLCGGCESLNAIRAIDPELSVSLSNLDHETANKVWRARK